jgi:hypothetical protein
VVFYLKEMAPEEADEKYANVMRQRHMFIYKKECARPVSLSCAVCIMHVACSCLAEGDAPFSLHAPRHVPAWMGGACIWLCLWRGELLHAPAALPAGRPGRHACMHALLSLPDDCDLRPSNPPSASDVVIEGMCEYALNGYGQTNLMEFEDQEEVQERDRKRRVKKYKDKKAADQDA